MEPDGNPQPIASATAMRKETLPAIVLGMSLERILRLAHKVLDEVPDEAMDTRWQNQRQTAIEDLEAILENVRFVYESIAPSNPRDQ